MVTGPGSRYPFRLGYERLTEGLYASLQAQTHLAPLYNAIVWTHSEVTGRAFGDLAQAEALLDAELAADPIEGRALVNEFGRLLRGLGLTRSSVRLGDETKRTVGASNDRSWRRTA